LALLRFEQASHLRVGRIERPTGPYSFHGIGTTRLKLRCCEHPKKRLPSSVAMFAQMRWQQQLTTQSLRHSIQAVNWRRPGREGKPLLDFSSR